MFLSDPSGRRYSSPVCGLRLLDVAYVVVIVVVGVVVGVVVVVVVVVGVVVVCSLSCTVSRFFVRVK